jgi:NSS family neurotransmitter:Na+ symporter
MSDQKPRFHEIWTSRWTFILAATGSAVGLGNIWKFPYIAGENGGGAFVLIYLVCIALVGIPVMIAEVLMGRWGRSSPIHTMYKLTDECGAPRVWHGIGWMGVIAGIIILSYYSVIAGWAIAYILKMASGAFVGIGGEGSEAIFSDLLSSPMTLVFWHSIFMLMTLMVVALGVTRGLGRLVQILMPLLLVLLVIMMGFSIRYGDFGAAVNYLFSFHTDDLTVQGVMEAMGHAFFTLSLGMGAIMAYGAYMPERAPVGRTVLTIGILDTIVALLAGLAIFPIVFASSAIEASSGPGLLFVSLPIAIGNMPAGVFVGTLFFLLITLAAWSSSISLVEPAIAWLTETGRGTRLQGAILFGLACWILGLGTVFSFNHWESARLFGKFNFFEFADFLTASIMLPLGGLLMAIFVGRLMARKRIEDEVQISRGPLFSLWYWILRWISPLAIGVIFAIGIARVFGWY